MFFEETYSLIRSVVASVTFLPLVSNGPLSPTSLSVSLVTCSLVIAILTKVIWKCKGVFAYISLMAKDVKQVSFTAGTLACDTVPHTL